MAILIHSASGRRIVLLPQHVFGRDRGASTVLDDGEASRLHASIRWTGTAWELRDHSRNGTTVDGWRIPYNSAVELKPGQALIFGVDGASAWRVQDLERPGPLLLSVDGQEAISLARSTLLPETDAASVSIVQEGDGTWLCTSEDGMRALQEGDEIAVDGRRWRFHSGFGQITEEVATTQQTTCVTRFDVSLDEEHVTLRLSHGDRELDLGERTHHYVLLTLARLRVDDATRGLPPSEQGWVYQDRLAKMLGLDSAHLNIQIFRLRRQLAQALGQDVAPPALIQRRRGALRMGDVAMEIRRGAQRPAAQ
ncbi:FHA domain-containing protein [Roseateles chitinivorans]|uniref:FHA domain-containing protein n=1 Tax=Roseateles chitinivorans TaxID=2917965 RepID=UPI003D66634A